jgi:hypothetical protein
MYSIRNDDFSHVSKYVEAQVKSVADIKYAETLFSISKLCSIISAMPEDEKSSVQCPVVRDYLPIVTSAIPVETRRGLFLIEAQKRLIEFKPR